MIQGLKDIYSILDSIANTKTIDGLKEIVIELQSKLSIAFNSNTEILERYAKLQDERSEMSQRLFELEAEIKNRDDWEKEKQKYEVHKLSKCDNQYTVVYKLKNSASDEIFCPNCFVVRRTAVHLHESPKNWQNIYCPNCKSEFKNQT